MSVLRGLERDKVHCGATGGFADGLRIGGLVSLHGWPDELRHDQSRLVAERLALTCQPVRTGSSHHGHYKAVKVANSSSYCLRVAFLRQT